MCGGYQLDADPEALVEAFRVDHSQWQGGGPEEHYPRMVGPIVLTRASTAARPEERWLGPARWGLVPPWAKELSAGDRLFNARAETLASLPSFREAFRRRRCVVPVTAFFEWRKLAGRSQRFVIRPTAGGIMALAGLWEIWRGPAGEKVGSYTVVTVDPNRVIAPIHDRMPVVLSAEAAERWLATQFDAEGLEELLLPCADAVLTAEPG